MTKRARIDLSFSLGFLTPAFLLFASFMVVPVLVSGYYSLTRWNGASAPVFVGLQNYVRIFHSDEYVVSLLNNLRLILAALLFQTTVAMVIAYLLFRTDRGFDVMRTIVFLPVVVAPLAIGFMFQMFFNSDLGPINYLLRRIGLGVFALRWLGDKHVAIYSCIFAQTWQYVGLFVVIFLAGLKGIPVEIFESANIEGASSFQTFLRIAVPLIIEYLSICVILAVTGCLKAFDQAWIMTKGGPGFASSYLAILMYKKAFIAGEFGFASAITMTILVLSLAFTYIYKKYIARDTVDY